MLTVGHLAVVAWFMLRPVPVPWVYGANLQLLSTINRELLADPVSGALSIAEGLVLLAPLGVLFPMLSGKVAVSAVGSFVRTVFFGAAVSFGIEALQTAVPGQVFDVDSLLLNTIGVAVAHLAVVPAARSRLRRRGFTGVRRPGRQRRTAATTAYPQGAAEMQRMVEAATERPGSVIRL